VSDILLTQTRLVTPEMSDIRSVLTRHLRNQGCNATSAEDLDAGVRFTWHTGSPSLAIIILTKTNFSLLQPLHTGLLQQPYPGELTIHIVDNGSDDPATQAYYEKLASQPNLAIIPYPRTFNYSEAINLGATQSQSDLLLFMNDDMALIDHTWLPELTQWAVRPEVGVVGAKLLRKNRTIQHAGIVMGLTGFAGHIYLNAPEHYHGLWGSVDWYRNMLALTGACQMVRREVFDEVGGYDQGYTLAFGDIDFCLRVHQKGYRNVYTPFAQLYHYEGSTRGYKTPVRDALKGYQELEPYLVEEDPFFSPNLTYTRIPKCTLEKQARDERMRQIESRKRFYRKTNNR
jgi:GT2 family glycosyltransferase